MKIEYKKNAAVLWTRCTDQMVCRDMQVVVPLVKPKFLKRSLVCSVISVPHMWTSCKLISFHSVHFNTGQHRDACHISVCRYIFWMDISMSALCSCIEFWNLLVFLVSGTHHRYLYNISAYCMEIFRCRHGSRNNGK